MYVLMDIGVNIALLNKRKIGLAYRFADFLRILISGVILAFQYYDVMNLHT